MTTSDRKNADINSADVCKLRWSRLPEFFRFATVGLTSAALGWALLFVLVSLAGIQYLVAFIISFVVLNAFAYIAVGAYAFKVGGQRSRRGLLRYYLISLGSMICNGVAMKVLVEKAELNYLLAAVLLSAVNAPINYLLHRRVTYRIGVRRSGVV